MAKHKKAGVRKWKRAENARYSNLFSLICKMWPEWRYFVFSHLYTLSSWE